MRTRKEITTARAEWAVSLTSPEYVASSLGPITVGVHTGVASTQDYLTPHQARELARNIIGAADAVECENLERAVADVPA